MAEAVAFAASLIAIVQVADRVIEVCKYYIENVDGCPKDIRVILVEISAIKAVFQMLEYMQQYWTNSSALLDALMAINGPVKGCQDSMNQLESLVPPPSRQSLGPRKRDAITSALASLAWPLKKDKARSLLNDIGQYKATVSLMLSTESWNDLQEIKQSLETVYEKISDKEKSDVCRWLEHTDPSPNHHAATNLYEPGTGDWVFRTPQWDSWVSYRCRCLWLHGIPGAGKTILAAHVAAAVEKLHQATPRHEKLGVATIYYYCYHGRNQDETASFLRWMVAQLCRLSDRVPDLVLRSYRMGGQSSEADLLASLREALGPFRAVFVTIDAVDESKSRECLLAVIRKLVTDPSFTKLQLFVTSREYEDIKRIMEPVAERVSMSNPHVESDIQAFVTTKISSTPIFSSWPVDLRDEVRLKLSEGAKGMFRWAVCQLDILRRCRTIPRVRKALADLPRTIEDSYARIFSYISQEDWPILAHTFRMIYCHSQLFRSNLPLSSNLLLSSFSEFGDPNADVDDSHKQHFYNTESIKDICGCLISFNLVDDMHEGAQLAHYTIREFLVSHRILGTNSAYFHINSDVTEAFYLKKVVENAIHTTTWEPFGQTEAIEGEPPVENLGTLSLQCYCLISSLTSIQKWENVAAEDDWIASAAARLMDPSNVLFSTRVRVLNHITRSWDGSFCFQNPYSLMFLRTMRGWIEIPNDVEAARVIFLFMSGLQTLARKYAKNIEASRISKLHFSFQAEYRQSMTVRIPVLLEGSAIIFMAQATRFFWGLSHSMNSLISILQPDHLGDPTAVLVFFIAGHIHIDCRPGHCSLTKLLQLGADPNALGYRVTPLQIAAFKGDHSSVKLLLEAGASPSCVGDPKGIAWDEKTYPGKIFNHLHGYSPLYLAQHPDSEKDFLLIDMMRVPAIAQEVQALLSSALGGG